MLKLSLLTLILFAQVSMAKTVVNGVGVKEDGGCNGPQFSGCGECRLKCLNQLSSDNRGNPKASLGQVGNRSRANKNFKGSKQ
jgi:hypothetical protein